MQRIKEMDLLGMVLLPAACIFVACSSTDDAVVKKTPDGGTSSEGTGGATSPDTEVVKAVVRSSCSDLPILDDRWTDTADDCKSCFDTQCCDEAQACGDDP